MEPKKEGRASFMVWIDPTLKQRLKEKAVRERRTIKWVITDLLTKWLREEEGK